MSAQVENSFSFPPGHSLQGTPYDVMAILAERDYLLEQARTRPKVQGGHGGPGNHPPSIVIRVLRPGQSPCDGHCRTSPRRTRIRTSIPSPGDTIVWGDATGNGSFTSERHGQRVRLSAHVRLPTARTTQTVTNTATKARIDGESARSRCPTPEVLASPRDGGGGDGGGGAERLSTRREQPRQESAPVNGNGNGDYFDPADYTIDEVMAWIEDEPRGVGQPHRSRGGGEGQGHPVGTTERPEVGLWRRTHWVHHQERC